MTTLATPPPPAEKFKPPQAAGATQRLMSVDALRGFDMFWIIGADSLVYALHRLSPSKPTNFLADQLEHADWQGFHFYDLIFPLFVFLVGVSIVFSLTKTIERAGKADAIKRVIRRGILLFVIGLLYSGGFSKAWPDMRLLGVLNRIALAYFFAGLLFCCFKPRALMGICIGLLITYWALMSFVPIRDIQLTRSNIARLAEQAGDAETAAYFADRSSPNPSTVKNSPAWAGAQKLFYGTTNYVRGKFDQGYNLSDHLDFQYLPGKKWDTFFDPEGYLSTLPAIATCLLGIFAGFLLQNQVIPGQKKVLYLISLGIAAAVLGWLWNFQFPVVKKIWTSSFVLVAGGYSAILLGTFYCIVDVWQLRAWCQPFVWMGMNSITVYLTKNILGGTFSLLAQRFVGGDVKTFFDTRVSGLGEMVISLVGLLLAFWFVHFLYKRKIFLRL
jgi:predicted acyltransferase